jgi:hypothetical protein
VIGIARFKWESSNGSANGSFHWLVSGRDDPARALYAFNFGRSEQFRSNISLRPFLCSDDN